MFKGLECIYKRIIISTLILLLGSTFTNIFKKYVFFKYMYFINLDINCYIGCYTEKFNNLYIGETILKHLIYGSIFLLMSMYLFNKKALNIIK